MLENRYVKKTEQLLTSERAEDDDDTLMRSKLLEEMLARNWSPDAIRWETLDHYDFEGGKIRTMKATLYWLYPSDYEPA